MATLTNGTQTIEAGARTSTWRSLFNAAAAVLDSLRGSIGTGFVFGEVPTGLVNGSNQNYDTANAYKSGTLRVYGNGLRYPASQITEIDTNTFQISAAPATGTVLIVDYSKE